VDEIGAGNLALVTVHEYLTSTCLPEQAAHVTVPNMLSELGIESYISQVLTHSRVGTVERRGLGLKLEETGYTGCSNKPGVNDVFADTLWSLDWLFVNFELGFRSVNFYLYPEDYSVVHATAVPAPNGAVRYTALAEPGYYALYTFSRNAQGKALLPTVISTGANVKAYAARDGQAGPVTVFVLNKDLKAAGTVSVETSAAMGAASLLLVSAPDLNSNKVSYGGTSFDANAGQLSGSPRTAPIRETNGKYRFDLPNASIAVLTIEPSDAATHPPMH
jgi:hypothetical protein